MIENNSQWEPEWGFDVPKNVFPVWHRGSRSFMDMYSRKRDSEGFEKHDVEMGFRYIANEQVAPFALAVTFMEVMKLAIKNPDQNFHFAVFDNEDLVPENNNNAPLRFDEQGKMYKRAKTPEQPILVENTVFDRSVVNQV